MKLRITVQNTAYDVDVEVLDAGTAPASVSSVPVAPTTPAPAAAVPPRPAPAAPTPAAGGGQSVTSPIAGNVLEVKVNAGDAVAVNDVVIVLEAMKMESNVVSPHAGTIAQVLVKAGDTVTAGQELVTF